MKDVLELWVDLGGNGCMDVRLMLGIFFLVLFCVGCNLGFQVEGRIKLQGLV